LLLDLSKRQSKLNFISLLEKEARKRNENEEINKEKI
jgi:hypothetical protein